MTFPDDAQKKSRSPKWRSLNRFRNMYKIQLAKIFIIFTVLALYDPLLYPFFAYAQTSAEKTMNQNYYSQIHGITEETIEPEPWSQPKHLLGYPTDSDWMSDSTMQASIGQQDLVLYFDFLKAPKNSKIEDLSGNGNHASIYGPFWREKAGIYFSGNNQYLVIKDAPSLGAMHGFSIAGEFMPVSYDERPLHLILWKGKDPNCTEISEHSDYAIWINSDGNLYFSVGHNDQADSGKFLAGTSGGSITGRTFFAAVFDRIQGRMKIYLNGDPAAETEVSDTDIFHSNAPIIID
ncbi:MAG: hypothetical protein DRH24_16440, partial [Deltaproteobacteria bacterium]